MYMLILGNRYHMGTVVKLVLALLNPIPPGAFSLVYLSRKEEQNKKQQPKTLKKEKKLSRFAFSPLSHVVFRGTLHH